MNRQAYIDGARERAKRRKSGWNLFLFILGWPMFGGAGWLLFQVISFVQSFIAPDKVFNSTMSNLGEVLMVIPLLFPAFVIGMMAANCLMWCIPPARRTFALEAEGHPGTDFSSAMKDLAFASAICLVVTVPVSLLGAVDPF